MPDEQQDAPAGPTRQIVPLKVFALALAGVVLAGGLGLTLGHLDATSAAPAPAVSPSTEGAVMSDTSSKRASAEFTNLCGGELADVAPSSSGLELAIAFPATASSTADRIRGVVRITNTSATRLTGDIWPGPAMALSRDGVVLWHTGGAHLGVARPLDLEPGESFAAPAVFVPVACTAEADSDDLGVVPDFAHVDPGVYQLSALVDFRSDSGVDLVAGPMTTITLD